MTWRLVALSVTLVPAVFAWWSGRQIVRLAGDPALGERLLARQGQLQLVLLGCITALIVAGTPYGWIATPCAFVGAWVGDLPSRRVLFMERWSLLTYLSWQGRFTLAYFGFWALLLGSPLLIHEAGPALRWPVTVLLAAALLLWNRRYAGIFLWLVGATAIPTPAAWEAVMRRSTAPRPRLLRFPVPGGRVLGAFALPSVRGSAVLFSEPLLESFDEGEQAAVLGHEIAHLEHLDGARLRRLALVGDGLALGSTVGIALVLHLLADAQSAVLVASLWVGALLAALCWSTAAQKRHEADSDARAVTLCGDAEAVVRALVKLTLLSGLPRRWGPDFERACSHPSLARRIQAVRRAVGVAAPPLEAPVEIAGAMPGSVVLFDADRATWMEGVPADCPRRPAAMRQRARHARTFPYSDLVDLRIVAGLSGQSKLVATARTGESWGELVEPAAVESLQTVLDRIDGLLTHEPIEDDPPPMVSWIVSLLLIGVAAFGQALGAAILAGIIGIARPGRAALSAVAAVGVSCVLLHLDALGRTALSGSQLSALVCAGLVVMAATWLSARGRRHPERRLDFILPIGAYAAAGALAWVPLAWEVTREAGALPLAVAIHRTPATWITVLALAAALMTVRRRSVRWIASAMAATVVGSVLVLSIADRASRVAAREARPGAAPEAAAILGRIELPAGSARLRLSPSARRFAVALPGRGSPPRFLIGTLDGEHVEIPAVDLQFVDDDHALVVVPAGDRHVVQHVDARAPGSPLWQIVVEDPPDPYIEYIRAGRWAVAGSDASEGFVGAFGRLGEITVERRRWQADLRAEGRRFRVEALSPEHALEVVTVPTAMARMPGGPLLYWRSGQPTESRIWLLEPGRQRHLATWPGAVRCTGPVRAAATAVCVGWRAWEGGVVVWRFDPERPAVGSPIDLPEDVWRWGLSQDGRLFATYARDMVTLVDLGQRSLVRRTVERESSVATDLAPAPQRLAMLWDGESRRRLVVYDTR